MCDKTTQNGKLAQSAGKYFQSEQKREALGRRAKGWVGKIESGRCGLLAGRHWFGWAGDNMGNKIGLGTRCDGIKSDVFLRRHADYFLVDEVDGKTEEGTAKQRRLLQTHENFILFQRRSATCSISIVARLHQLSMNWPISTFSGLGGTTTFFVIVCNLTSWPSYLAYKVTGYWPLLE